MSMEIVTITAITTILLIYASNIIYLHIQIVSLQHSLHRSLQAILQMQEVLEYFVTNTANPPSSGLNEEDEAAEAGGLPPLTDGDSHQGQSLLEFSAVPSTIVVSEPIRLPPAWDDKPNSTSIT